MLGSVANHQAGLCAKMPKKMAEDVVKKLQVPPLLSCAAVLLCSAALSLWLCRARVQPRAAAPRGHPHAPARHLNEFGFDHVFLPAGRAPRLRPRRSAASTPDGRGFVFSAPDIACDGGNADNIFRYGYSASFAFLKLQSH